MATRFYLPSTGTPGISPAVNGSWTRQSPNFDRRKMVTTRINSAMTDSLCNPGDTTVSVDVFRQYVSVESLAGQTLAGSIKGQMRCMANEVGVGNLFVGVFKCNSGGTGLVTLLAITASARVAEPPLWDQSAALTNRRLEQGTSDFVLELTSTGISSGDFLIIELGGQRPASDTAEGTINFGDNSATDLAEDETATAADNPWVEFSQTVLFSATRQPLATSRLPLKPDQSIEADAARMAHNLRLFYGRSPAAQPPPGFVRLFQPRKIFMPHR